MTRIPTNETGMTLAALVRAVEPDWSWNRCREVIAAGRVSVAGEVVLDQARRFPAGTEVIIAAHGRRPPPALPSIQVYFHDAHLIVVEKPSGIESVPFETRKSESKSNAGADATLIDLARRWLEIKERRKLPPLRVVHRIDKGTSGILVFARTPAAEKGLGRQFRDHSITRKYLAICAGLVKSRTIKSRLIDDRGDGYRGSTTHRDLGKPAVTHVECLATTPSTGYSLVACRLETGRTHQIRIHLCESGHPLCGDTVYRRPVRGDADLPDPSRSPRLALHAAELGFVHPASNAALHFASPFPDDLRRIWQTLGGAPLVESGT